MTILQVCAFAAEYPGNFMATLSALETAMGEKGAQTIYAFPQRAAEKAWCKELCQRTKVYFLPEANARILPATYKAFKRIYAENDVKIVHSHFELYDIPATAMAPKHAKIFWHLHDPIGDDFESTGFLRRVLTKLQYGLVGKRATLLSVSEKHGAFAVSIGFPADQMVYFPNGINTDRIQRVPWVDLPAKKQLLLLGWDVYRKGVDVLVNAAQQLNRNDFLVRVIGLDKCEEYLQQNAVATLQFLRPVTDINTLFRDTFAFLHISRAEGQSYALLEAIYAGLPVICSDIPENKFAEQFRNIYWVQVGNADELACRLAYLLDCVVPPSPEDIELNRNIIDEQYSIKAWVSKLCATYMAE